MTPEREMVELVLKPLKVFGLHPDQSYSVMFCRTFLVINSFLKVMVMGMVACWVSDNFGDVDVLLDAVNSFCCGIEVAIKIIPFVFYKNELRAMHLDLDKFWQTDVKKYEKLYKFYKYSLYSSFGAFFLFCAVTKTLIAECCLPEMPHARVAIYLLELATFGTDCFVYVAVDSYFVVSCFVLKRQYDLLEEYSKRIDEETTTEGVERRLREWQKHHELIANYTDTLSEVFSMTFLLQYLANIAFICSQVFVVDRKKNLEDLTVPFIEFWIQFFQMCILCIPAAVLADTADNVPMMVYSVKWYDWPINLQKNLWTIIHRAQRPATFTGMGIVSIDITLFTIIFQKAYSFYTIAKNLA